MAQIKIINGDAKDHAIAADLIVTDPPFEMDGKELAAIIEQYDAKHLLLICSMRQLLDFYQHSTFKLNFDLVIDIVAPKQSKSVHQPFYTHVHAVYLTKNRAKSLFNRKDGQRSDVFTAGYFPSIVRAPRERSGEHGHAKNQQAMQDILSCFNVSSVIDMFAGSGTTGLACLELDIDCTLIERDKAHFDNMQQTFNFIGAI